MGKLKQPAECLKAETRKHRCPALQTGSWHSLTGLEIRGDNQKLPDKLIFPFPFNFIPERNSHRGGKKKNKR